MKDERSSSLTPGALISIGVCALLVGAFLLYQTGAIPW